MKELVDVLTIGSLESILPAVDEVWKQVDQWGMPKEGGTHFQEV
jgi:hypothetical protein